MAPNYDGEVVSSWVKVKIAAFSRVDSQPPKLLAWIGGELAGQGITHISRKLGLLCRYLYVNSISFDAHENDNQAQSAIEVLFVATSKDFRTLGLAIQGVLETCGQEISKINIVVPDVDIELCETALADCKSNLLQIISESSLVDKLLIKSLFSRFGTRGGWALQQVLKLEFVRKSKSLGVLVVDADTILLKKRNWLNSDGVQLLMPSWEYHKPYYDFLNTLKIFGTQSTFTPKFSFVTHHMIMQPPIVQEIYNACDWNSPEELVHSLIVLSSKENESPFSIDYELYGHFLLENHSNRVVLTKWSNASAKYSNSISMKEIFIQYSAYASVSLHAYLS